MLLISYQIPSYVVGLSNTPFSLHRVQNHYSSEGESTCFNDAIMKLSK